MRNLCWVEGRAEDLPGELGMFQVVLFAQSFHWTDRERVAATIRDMDEIPVQGSTTSGGSWRRPVP